MEMASIAPSSQPIKTRVAMTVSIVLAMAQNAINETVRLLVMARRTMKAARSDTSAACSTDSMREFWKSRIKKNA